MNFEITTHTRDDMIEVGHMLGRIFKDSDRKKPWMVTLGGDTNSGKSLMGSAVDQIFEPFYYPEGITKLHFAEFLMYEKPCGPVKYLNAQERFQSRQDFDRRLHRFEQSHPTARVLMCANIERASLSGTFNYQSQGLQSDRLDMNINVSVIAQPFERRIVITAEDTYLRSALSNNGLSFNGIRPSGPLPPA